MMRRGPSSRRHQAFLVSQWLRVELARSRFARMAVDLR